MKFVGNQKTGDTFGLVCRMCPMHIMEQGDRLNCMKKGQILEVLRGHSLLSGDRNHLPNKEGFI
jgi:TusA-related sulfurtransferase